jgi:hypothetical protein
MGDMKMRSQVVAGIVVVGLLTVAPVSATIVDFSTNPNLATEWTQYGFYVNGTPNYTAAWNGTNQNLDLASTNSEGLAGLFKTGDTRSDADGVTVTYSNYVSTPASWTCAGLIVSANTTPAIFDGSPWYSVYFQQDGASGYRFSVNRNLTEINRTALGGVPGTMKLDILRDGSDYVFKANGVELCRDTAYSATSLPHYFMYWGSAANDTLSVSADNYGVVPEPGTLALAGTALLGLLCYAWRKRKW